MKTSMFAVLIAATAAAGLTTVARAENTMYSCVGADGVVALTNQPNGGTCEKLFSYAAPPPDAPAAPAAAPAPAPVATTHADTYVANSTPAPTPDVQPEPRKSALVTPQSGSLPAPRNALETRLSQRRDDAIMQTRDAMNSNEPEFGVNRAVNRRYLMINRADYQATYGVTP